MHDNQPTEESLILDGASLDAQTLVEAARGRPQITLCPSALTRMQESRRAVMRAIEEGTPVYGLTTGLGSRAGVMLDEETRRAFPAHMVRGRAQATGAPLSAETTRAAMIARLNGFCLGHAGVRPEVAEALCNWLNAGLTPAVGSIGSIGASDLCQGADIGLAMIGEGWVLDEDDHTRIPAGPAIEKAGLTPLILEEKDGLPLISHAGVSLGRAALAFNDAKRLYSVLDATAVLTLSGFGANPSAFDPTALAASGLVGDAKASEAILNRLKAEDDTIILAARRLQDPLSLRQIPQLQGALKLALDFAEPILNQMINGSQDNPCVLAERETILSIGNYHTPSLALAVETVSRALAPAATASVARISKLLISRFTELPQYLAAEGPANNGIAPAMKIAESLNIEIQRLAICRPATVSFCADGVEDVGTTAPGAAADLEELLGHFYQLAAWELAVAAAAVEARDRPVSAEADRILDFTRRFVRPVGPDRPRAREVEALADALYQEAI